MGELATVLARLRHDAEVDAEVDAPLAAYTTYKVGGPAAALVRVNDEDALGRVVVALAGTTVPVLVVGRGSNLLVHDDGFAGIVVLLGDGFTTVTIDGSRVVAGAGASLPVVARRTAAEALTGFEWAVGVPGSMGGAVRMNAGGHGSDMSETVVAADVIDLHAGARRRLGPADLDFAYRTSSIGPAQVVVAVELDLAPGDRAAAEAEIADIVAWRRANQPGGRNAGSVFVNPPGDSAGRLIEASGCKGLRVGTAEVSPKHANFIQADDGGVAADVHALMVLVRSRVLAATGIALRAETHLVGLPAVDTVAPLRPDETDETDDKEQP